MVQSTNHLSTGLENASPKPNGFAMQTSRNVSSGIVQELRDFLEASDNADFKKDFEASFSAALSSGIREFEDFSITTLKDYIDWYEYLLGWVPSEQQDGKFVYRVLCLFYFVMNLSPLQLWTDPIEPATHSPYKWLSAWVIRYAKAIGSFMDSPDSITPYTIDTFRNSPSYHMEDYPEPVGGWKTFNEFFARHIDLTKRPIDSPDTNSVIVSPADAVFDGAWKVNADAAVEIKGVPWPVTELLDDANSSVAFGELFKNGWFCHSFLGPNDYHRQHAPVSGRVLEARLIEGLCYLQVEVQQDENGRWTIAPRRRLFGPRLAALPEDDPALVAPDEPGYQFIQARALVLIETPDIGVVAVLPIGMAHVSSVVLSVEAGQQVQKGDEISYFQFGGSDIVMVFEEKADVQFTAEVGTHYNFGQKVAQQGIN